MLRTVLLSMSLSAACAGAAHADPDMMRPFGVSAGGYEDPFYAPSRDNSGVRVVVNGRAVDLQERSGGYSADYPMRGGVSGGPTMRGPTLSSMAIGNSVSVSLDRKFNRGGRSIGPGPLPREQRGAGFGATATAPVRLAGGSACGPDG